MPSSAATGTGRPRTRTFNGTTYGRGRSGSEKRSFTTAAWAIANVINTPKLYRLARKRVSRPTEAETITIAIETTAAPRIAAGGNVRRRPDGPEGGGKRGR